MSRVAPTRKAEQEEAEMRMEAGLKRPSCEAEFKSERTLGTHRAREGKCRERKLGGKRISRLRSKEKW